MAGSPLLGIGELSKRSGVSADLLRAWERRYWLRLVTPVRAAVARALQGLRSPTVADDDRIHRLLPLALTSFCDAARRVLDPAWERRPAAR